MQAGWSNFHLSLPFRSDVDTTVATSAIVTGLFEKLAPKGHELVLFDINRFNETAKFFKNDPKSYLDNLLERNDLSYTLTVIANENEESRQVHLMRKAEAGNSIETAVRWRWPGPKAFIPCPMLPFPFHQPIRFTEKTAPRKTRVCTWGTLPSEESAECSEFPLPPCCVCAGTPSTHILNRESLILSGWKNCNAGLSLVADELLKTFCHACYLRPVMGDNILGMRQIVAQ